MSRVSLSMGVLAAVVSGSVLSAAPAQAHIVMTGPIASRNSGDLFNAQKMYPCDGNRGDGPVYTFEPGTTITLAVSEYVAHPSYYRIAFDNDGDDDFKEPLSIDPIDPNRDANGKCLKDNKFDNCGASDFCNTVSASGPSVLWDDLNPHLAGSGNAWSWNVKLPDIECDNCTIQIIQVMEDSSLHGPYCVHGDDCVGDTSAPDIYHRCIDIKLVKGATNSDGATTDPVNNTGMECAAHAGQPIDQPTDGGTPIADPSGDTTGSPTGTQDAATSHTTQADASSASGSSSGGSTKKDAGSIVSDAGSSGDNSSEPKSSSDDGGCAVAQRTNTDTSTALCSLVAIGAALMLRRRRAAA